MDDPEDEHDPILGEDYTFGTFTLKPGETVKVHTGAGSNTAAQVYQDADGVPVQRERDACSHVRVFGGGRLRTVLRISPPR
jgi:hypothetical protein